jgi:hypothetical protein
MASWYFAEVLEPLVLEAIPDSVNPLQRLRLRGGGTASLGGDGEGKNSQK